MLAAKIILCAFVVLILLVAYVCYRITFYNANKVPDDPHRIPTGPKYEILYDEIHALVNDTLAIPYEEVRIKSRDNLTLYAKLMFTDNPVYSPDPKKAPFAVLMHGWHGIAERDFAAGVQIHLEHGVNVLLVDERAHNKSEGHTITFGIKERFDCIDWVRYLINTFGKDTQIIIHGVSMGGGTVLMTAGLMLPDNVKGIISDCGYTSPKEIICKVIRDKKLNPSILYPFVKLGAFLYGHFDPDSASGAEAMKTNTLPIMFIHGTGDDFVPYEMSDICYSLTKGPKYMVKVPGAPHVMAYMYDKELYLKVINEFYKATLH